MTLKNKQSNQQKQKTQRAAERKTRKLKDIFAKTYERNRARQKKFDNLYIIQKSASRPNEP